MRSSRIRSTTLFLFTQMIDIKLSLTIALRGSDMFSSQECEENPELLNDEYLRIQDQKTKKFINLYYKTRKCKEASQTINMCQEAYDEFTSLNIPDKYNSFKEGKRWKDLSKKKRLEWHLKEIAESLNGRIIDYVIYGD